MSENNEENDGTKAYAKGKPENMEIEIKLDRNAELEEKQRQIEELQKQLYEVTEHRAPTGGNATPLYSKYANMTQQELDDLQNPPQDNPVYGSDLPVEFWEFNSEQEMKDKLDEAVSGKYGNQRKEEAIAINKRIRAQTSRISQIRGQEFELESKPLNCWKFNGLNKPATFIKKEDRVKPKMIPVNREAKESET